MGLFGGISKKTERSSLVPREGLLDRAYGRKKRCFASLYDVVVIGSVERLEKPA
jgi:hypothetical protein